ncbi:MAG: hypothetical protein AB7N76_04150 [Planctomycetota bacterium]
MDEALRKALREAREEGSCERWLELCHALARGGQPEAAGEAVDAAARLGGDVSELLELLEPASLADFELRSFPLERGLVCLDFRPDGESLVAVGIGERGERRLGEVALASGAWTSRLRLPHPGYAVAADGAEGALIAVADLLGERTQVLHWSGRSELRTLPWELEAWVVRRIHPAHLSGGVLIHEARPGQSSRETLRAWRRGAPEPVWTEEADGGLAVGRGVAALLRGERLALLDLGARAAREHELEALFPGLEPVGLAVHVAGRGAVLTAEEQVWSEDFLEAEGPQLLGAVSWPRVALWLDEQGEPRARRPVPESWDWSWSASPTGRYLLGHASHLRLCALDLRTGEARTWDRGLVPDPDGPWAWSASGRSFAFARGGSLAVLSARGA